MAAATQAPPQLASFVPSAADADAVRALLSGPRAAAAPLAECALFVAAAHGSAALVRAALALLPPRAPPLTTLTTTQQPAAAREAPPVGAPTPLHAAAVGGFAEAMLVRIRARSAAENALAKAHCKKKCIAENKS
jgi:hypothetical protein